MEYKKGVNRKKNIAKKDKPAQQEITDKEKYVMKLFGTVQSVLAFIAVLFLIGIIGYFSQIKRSFNYFDDYELAEINVISDREVVEIFKDTIYSSHVYIII